MGKEHWAAFKVGSEGSHILKHHLVHHGGAGEPAFHLRAVKYYKTALNRQVGEAVRIKRRGGEDCLLNSKAEFNRCHITRLTLPQAGSSGSAPSEPAKFQTANEGPARSQAEGKESCTTKPATITDLPGEGVLDNLPGEGEGGLPAKTALGAERWQVSMKEAREAEEGARLRRLGKETTTIPAKRRTGPGRGRKGAEKRARLELEGREAKGLVFLPDRRGDEPTHRLQLTGCEACCRGVHECPFNPASVSAKEAEKAANFAEISEAFPYLTYSQCNSPSFSFWWGGASCTTKAI